MIDRRELLEKARERELPLGMVEKDYILGWLLFGLSDIKGLVFKGGTALSKVYFPKMWRLSEDLDFVFTGDFRTITDSLESAFGKASEKSGLGFRLRSSFSNPGYLQLKIQDDAILGRNWAKMDVTREAPVDRVAARRLGQTFSDYPAFRVKVESLEEIGAEKLRSLIERKKCRDFYDACRLLHLELDLERLRWLFLEKCKYKGLRFSGLDQLLPDRLENTLSAYWERELGRLVRPVPEMRNVLRELGVLLRFLG
ncbi:MAG: nucleotidyl transferase AbiEii/AbiGii toxin family protein [Thermodesulfobacteriota bacterium]